MINAGSGPVEGATEEQAEQSLRNFIFEATERGLNLTGEPLRQRDADIDGRYGWTLPVEGGIPVPILMPGVEVAQLRALSASTPRLKIGDHLWWWNDAIGMIIAPAKPKKSAAEGAASEETAPSAQ